MEAPIPRGRSRRLALAACCALLAVAACSGSDDSTAPDSSAASTTSAGAGPADTTTTAPDGDAVPVLFGGDGNNLDAYEVVPPFRSQRINSAFEPEPPQQSDRDGTDINAQICFFEDGSGRFIAGEDRNQSPEDPQGWGIFELSGDRVGSFAIEQLAKLVPTFQASPDNAENYGCGILSDGRVVTTDIGDQATGDPNGQLIVWFPPFDSEKVAYCKIDVAISTAQSIYVDDADDVYVAAARATNVAGATGSGVWKYSGPFPTSADAAGGCGRTDATGAPLADGVDKTIFIAAGEHSMVTPAGIVPSPGGGFYVSSVFTGVINEYDEGGAFVRTILEPPAGESLGAEPYSTGTPLGLAIGPDGTLYYADIGIVAADGNVGPGSKTGTERRITFTDGDPNPPETMAEKLDYPDGVGVFVPGA